MSEGATDERYGAALRQLALLALGIAAALALVAPATMLWDRDEGFYARAAAEMLRSGDWLLPTFNGEVFADKPPLIYWLMASSMAVFGENEFAGRIVSVMAQALSAFFTGLIALRLAGRRAALWSAAAFATMGMAFYLGAAVMLDATLTLFVVAALWAYGEIVARARPPAAMLGVFTAALALGLLTKGPVAPAVVGGAVGLSLLLLPREDRPSLAMAAALFAAALVSLAPFLAWLLPADARSGGEILRSGFGVHVLGRALAPMEGHGGAGLTGYLLTLPLYVPVVALGVAPWLGFVAGGLARQEAASARPRRARAFLISWIAPAFLLFTLAATKLPHYVFPVFPALAIAAGLAIDGASANRWMRIGAAVQFALLALLSILVAAAPAVLPGVVGWAPALGLAGALAASAVIVFQGVRAGQIVRAAQLTFVASALFWPALYWFALTGVDHAFKVTKPMAQAIAAANGAGAPVFTTGYVEPSFVFYLGLPPDRPVRRLPENDAEAAALLRETPTFALAATAQRLDALAAALGEPVAEIGRWTAVDINDGVRTKTTIAVGRGLAPGGQ